MQTDGSTMAETSEFHAAYAVLGLSAAPSSSEAKTAFRVRAALLHPDVHQSAGADRMSAATTAMQQLNDAYQLVLESLVNRRCRARRTSVQGRTEVSQASCHTRSYSLAWPARWVVRSSTRAS